MKKRLLPAAEHRAALWEPPPPPSRPSPSQSRITACQKLWGEQTASAPWKGLQQNVFSVRRPERDFCPVFTTAARHSVTAISGGETAAKRCSGMHQRRSEALLTADAIITTMPQREMQPESHASVMQYFSGICAPLALCYLAGPFQLFLLFLPLPTSPPPPSLPPPTLPSRNLWNSLKLKWVWFPA